MSGQGENIYFTGAPPSQPAGMQYVDDVGHGLPVRPVDAAGNPLYGTSAAAADATANPTAGAVRAFPFVWNGATWDRQKGTGGAANVIAGLSVTVAASITRPNDTNTYASGDAITDSTSAPTVAGGYTFAGCARATGAGGLITGAVLLDSAAVTAKGSFEVWIFQGAANMALDNDNAVFTPTDAELANLVGVIPFTTAFVGDATSGAGGNCIFMADRVNIAFRCTATSLFGALVVRNAYVPVASEIFTVTLQIAQD